MPIESIIALGLGAGFFSFVAVSLILTRVDAVTIHLRPQPLSPARFCGTAFVFLPMALFEEFIFRWVMIGQLERWLGIIPAFLLSMLAFVVVHRPNGRLSFVAVLNLAVVGAVLGFVFLHWGLWVATAAHAGWNVAEWGLGYAVSGEKTRQFLPAPITRTVRGEPFGPEGHWATTAVLLAVLVVLIVTHSPHVSPSLSKRFL